MISGKGILYTVLGAAGAAAVVGTMLTGGTRSEKMRKLGSGFQNMISSFREKATSLVSHNSRQRAEFDQANRMGHS